MEIARSAGKWVIVTKGGFPVDATEQMATAATSLLDREILAAQPSDATNHADYGVLNPDETGSSSNSGYGKRIELIGPDDEVLADLIVGKQVKDSGDTADESAQHYVRRASQDAVLVADFNPQAFPTEFRRWVDRDLLGLQVPLGDDGAAPRIARVTIDNQGRMQFQPDTNGGWELTSLAELDESTNTYEQLEVADQEASDALLSELVMELDGLEIVDVRAKPEDVQPEQLSKEGHVVVTLDTGVEYVLRFGSLQVDSADGVQPAGGLANSPAGLNRYVYLTARLGDDADAETTELSEDRKAVVESRVEELNERFGDWFYLIPNRAYEKIYLSKDQLLEPTNNSADAEPAPDAE